jgi:hypothetical protein
MKRWRTVDSTPTGVLVAGDQRDATAKRDFDVLVSRVASGEVKGVLIQDPDAPRRNGRAGVASRAPHAVRRGAMKGASFGFLFGLLPLAASTVAAAAAGGLLAKAAEVRIEKGTAPRLRFSKPDDGD